jgi:hypothetical protein
MSPCRFVMQRLERPGDIIFGTPRLEQAWRRAVLAHPLAYLQHRTSFAWKFLAGPHLTLELYHARDPQRTPLARSRPFWAMVALHDWLKPTPLFRIGFWLLGACLVCALAWRMRETVAGAFAIAVTASAIAYLLTFIPFGVAADFRYGYWAVLATLVGGAALLARHTRANPATAPSP